VKVKGHCATRVLSNDATCISDWLRRGKVIGITGKAAVRKERSDMRACVHRFVHRSCTVTNAFGKHVKERDRCIAGSVSLVVVNCESRFTGFLVRFESSDDLWWNKKIAILRSRVTRSSRTIFHTIASAS
jgi:hypothetical protein